MLSYYIFTKLCQNVTTIVFNVMDWLPWGVLMQYVTLACFAPPRKLTKLCSCLTGNDFLLLLLLTILKKMYPDGNISRL